MRDETSTAENPIGLYKDPASGKYIGAIHPAQADAMIQQGYTLIKAGSEAAMYSEKQIAEILAKQAEAPAEVQPATVEDVVNGS